jgi:hypothetical protein
MNELEMELSRCRRIMLTQSFYLLGLLCVVLIAIVIQADRDVPTALAMNAASMAVGLQASVTINRMRGMKSGRARL